MYYCETPTLVRKKMSTIAATIHLGSMIMILSMLTSSPVRAPVVALSHIGKHVSNSSGTASDVHFAKLLRHYTHKGHRQRPRLALTASCAIRAVHARVQHAALRYRDAETAPDDANRILLWQLPPPHDPSPPRCENSDSKMGIVIFRTTARQHHRSTFPQLILRRIQKPSSCLYKNVKKHKREECRLDRGDQFDWPTSLATSKSRWWMSMSAGNDKRRHVW